MKYIVIEDRAHAADGLLYDVADFFWNAGNEVLIRDKNSKIDYQDIAGDHYCKVLLVSGNSFERRLFTEGAPREYTEFEWEVLHGKRPILVFSEDGVYSNAIPYPHKIFHFKKLEQNEVARFFQWRSKITSVF